MPASAASAASADGAVRLLVNYGEDGVLQLLSHGNLIEPLGMLPDQTQAVTLVCSADKAGQPVTFTPADGGGEVIAAPNVAVANDGTVAFSVKASQAGHYRILVTLGADQYQLQLYVVPKLLNILPGPLSTPPLHQD